MYAYTQFTHTHTHFKSNRRVESSVWHDSFRCVWHDSFICVACVSARATCMHMHANTHFGESAFQRNHSRRQCGEVGGWGRDPFSRNFMKPTPRRKWYLTTGRRFHWMVFDPIPQSLPVHFFGSRPQPPTSRNAILAYYVLSIKFICRYIYMYVCMYMDLCIYICLYIYMYACIICIRIHMHTFAYIHVCTYTNAYSHAFRRH